MKFLVRLENASTPGFYVYTHIRVGRLCHQEVIAMREPDEPDDFGAGAPGIGPLCPLWAVSD